MIGSTSGSDTKLAQPASSQSKSTQTRFVSLGSRNTVAPWDPWWARLSAPFVLNTSRNRSTSSTCVVARIMSLPFAGIRVDLVAPTGRSAWGSLSGSTPRLASVDLPIFDDLVRDGPAGGRGTAGDADLRVDVLHVVLGGPRRDEQLGGDLARGPPVGHQPKHF